MPNDVEDIEQDEQEDSTPAADYVPGQYAPHWYSPHKDADMSDELKKQIMHLCDLVGKKDVAARRWEVEQSWEARLFDRGYQFLLPRRGGGWQIPGLSFNGGNTKSKYTGLETNIYTTYGEVLTGALTRDIPQVRFEPQNPMDDGDLTAADNASKFAMIFGRNNDLLNFQQQLVYYLRNDGRSVIVTDYVLDAQRFGTESNVPAAVPETETQEDQALLYMVNQEQGDQPSEQGEFLAKKGIKRIVASPHPEAQQTAQAISQKTNIPVETDDRLAPQEGQDQESNPTQEALFDHLQSAQQGGKTAIVAHPDQIGQASDLFNGDGGNTEATPGSIHSVGPQQGGGFNMQPANGPQPEQQESSPKQPRGQEVVNCYGKLEAKIVPINSQTQAGCSAIQVSFEVDVSLAKAMFPDYADKITPGSAGAGENELDRIARINACLSLEASYVTGDSMVRDCTLQRTWLRPSFFFEIEDKNVRAEAFQQFPDGAHCVYAGQTFVGARNECLDDHLTTVQAFPGSGQNRIALMSKVLSLQKRINNWVELINAFFVKTVPMKWMDGEAFDLEAIRNQGNTPGGIGKFQRQPGYTPDQLCWMEPTPTPQPALVDTIKYFIEDLAQLVSGALPSVFGDESNTDTVGGIAIQRDQALGRLGTPWHAIQMATCSYFRQAVMLAAKCRKNSINESIPGQGVISLELSDLKGNVLAFPTEDKNFPETWNQIQTRLQQLVTEMATTPLIAQLVSLPRNLKVLITGLGISEFKSPVVEGYEKQLGEFKELLKTSPMPNPQVQQMKQELIETAGQYKQQVDSGAVQDPNIEQGLQKMQQNMAALPPLVSSVPIDPQTDNHEGELAACLDWMNGAEGRKYKNGTQEERMAFANVHTHWSEHDEADSKQKQAAAAATVIPPKPASINMPIDKLPPGPAADAARKSGIAATPQDFAIQDEAQEASKMLDAHAKESNLNV